MKIISLILLSVLFSIPSKPLNTNLSDKAEPASGNFRIKKTRWLEPYKVFIYEVESGNKAYILKYHYGSPAGLEILDAKQNS